MDASVVKKKTITLLVLRNSGSLTVMFIKKIDNIKKAVSCLVYLR